MSSSYTRGDDVRRLGPRHFWVPDKRERERRRVTRDKVKVEGFRGPIPLTGRYGYSIVREIRS